MKRWIVLGVFLLAIVALVGWRLAKKSATDKEQAAAAKQRTQGPVSVSIAIAGPREIAQTLDAVGSTESPFSVKISPKIQGLIDYLQVREGDNVKAGEVLIKLDPDTTVGTVYQNESNLAAAEQNYAKAKITQSANDVGLTSAINQARAAVDVAQANYNVVIQNLNARLEFAKAGVSDANAKIAQDRAGVASAEASVLSAKATLKNAKVTLDRDLELYRQNYIAAQSVDDQKTAVEVAEAQVNVAQKALDAANQLVESATQERDEAQATYDQTKKQANADIANAKATLHSSQEALKTAQANISESPAYAENLKALKSAELAARGTLQASKTLLNDTNLSSPIDGTVTARALDPGSIAQPGTAVLTIQYLKWLYFNASIPVENSSKVYEGQRCAVTLDGMPGHIFRGSITHVDHAADPTTHQFIVLVRIDNSNLTLRPGMFGHVDVVTNFVNAAVTVPREAVTTNADLSTTVVVVDANNTAQTRTVKLGASDAVGYQVLSGLTAGEKVVTLAYNALKDGRKVEIKAVTKQTTGDFTVDQLVLTPGSTTPPASTQGGATPMPAATPGATSSSGSTAGSSSASTAGSASTTTSGSTTGGTASTSGGLPPSTLSPPGGTAPATGSPQHQDAGAAMAPTGGGGH